MFEFLLYANMMCSDADALLLRIEKNRSLRCGPAIVLELVETVKNLYLSVVTTGTQTTEGTGKTDPRKREKVQFHPFF